MKIYTENVWNLKSWKGILCIIHCFFAGSVFCLSLTSCSSVYLRICAVYGHFVLFNWVERLRTPSTVTTVTSLLSPPCILAIGRQPAKVAYSNSKFNIIWNIDSFLKSCNPKKNWKIDRTMLSLINIKRFSSIYTPKNIFDWISNR